MNCDIETAKKHLKAGGYTCVLCKGDKIFTTSLRGVKPLVQLYQSALDYAGYSAADKVVGRGAAFLYVLLNIKAVYADVISRPAMDVLERYNIKVDYQQLVDNIVNRTGDGICPFEERVINIQNPLDAYTAILDKMKQLEISIN